MNWQNEVPKDRVLILLAAEFEELETIYCLKRFREASLPVVLVGLAAGLVKGKHGLLVHPDYSFDQLPAHQVSRLVILPGGKMCSTALMSDPRVHRLIHTSLDAGFYVAALAAAESVLTTELETPHFKRQGAQDLAEFAGELILLLAYGDSPFH